MEENKTAVIEEEKSVASNETQEIQTQEQNVEQSEQTQEVQTEVQSQQTDERGIDYKNVAMEYRRKLDEVPSLIQKTVQDVLAQNQTQTKPEYTVAQLEQYAIDNPQYRGWVEEEKSKIVQRNIERTLDERLKVADRQRSDAQVRQQTEQWISSHPKFKDCFINDITGNKVWNMNNPLTQIMSQILNQVDPVSGKMVKDRPDGLAVAAEMAYGRYALSSEPKTQSTVQKLQKDLRKAQKQTMVVGQGVNSSGKGTVTEYQQHITNYQKTYSPRDAQAATKAYLKGVGIIKEE